MSSSTVTYTSVYTNFKPWRFCGGFDEVPADAGSPGVIVYGYDGLPMHLVAPPSPDYVPRLEHPPSPNYMLFLLALIPGFVGGGGGEPNSDPEEDPEEDHANYPADGGDGDDEPSDDDDDDDDADDEDEKASEDEDDDEEEEHLAPADSSRFIL
ncbi:hypothetical protein Tco_0688993 [Tanacetum coccineum]